MPALRNIWRSLVRQWKTIASFLGKWNGRLLLTLFYFLLIGPVSLVLRLLRKDLLSKRLRERDSYWQDKDPVDASLERNTYQF